MKGINGRNLFWGLLFIFAAVLILINQLGYFPGVSMVDVFFTVIMIVIIIRSVRRLNFWGIFFPLGIILIINYDQLNIPNIQPWSILLAAFLISLGFSLLFNRSKIVYIHSRNKNAFSDTVENHQDSNVINCSTKFGDCIKYVNSENFERANINCTFGDVKMYFDNAKIPSGEAKISLNVSFGDLVLYFPREWNVENKVHVIFGEIDNNKREITADSPLVTIHGNVSFGDVRIVYV